MIYRDRPHGRLLFAPMQSDGDGEAADASRKNAAAGPSGNPEAGQNPSGLSKEHGRTQDASKREPGELQILQAISIFKAYLQEERNRYYPSGTPPGHKFAALRNFFSPSLLEKVRIVELRDQRVPNPSFYPKARALGFTNLPDISHQASMTFLDVVVFNERVEERKLFHGLIYAAQVRVLGIDRYVELFVRGFVRRKSYFMVPLKAHAFALDLRFVTERDRPFSVEEEIRHWAGVGLY